MAVFYGCHVFALDVLALFRQLVTWVLQLVAVDVLLLLVWTVLDRPRKVDRIDTVSDVGAREKERTQSLLTKR